MAVRCLPVSSRSLLLELDDLDRTLSMLASLQADPVPGVTELVPAARTILVTFDPALASAAGIAFAARSRRLAEGALKSGRLVTIPVHYTGEDLDEVASLLGITAEEVVRRHTESDYSVAFTGFVPGFAYLCNGHPSFDVPRKKTPRTSVPAGSVALAGKFGGIYPQASPGGWQIIGVTATPMWDPDRDPPALLQPGYRVKFEDAGPVSLGEVLPSAGYSPVLPEGDVAAALEVLEVCLPPLLQDRGRPGYAGQGVSGSGAMDRGALLAANLILGNAPDMACLEVAYGGLRVRAHGACVVAVTGADVPLTVENGAAGTTREVFRYQPVFLEDGDTLAMGMPGAGMRAYLGVRGGFAAGAVLGSLSTDTLAHIGPAPVMPGDRLGIRLASPDAAHGAVLPAPGDVVTLDVVLGPRTDWFTPEALRLFSTQTWEVTPDSNRVGLRLEGARPLTRSNAEELPSEGVHAGAIQVPAQGQPLIFLADHPLTGGYPVIGSVAAHHLDLAGQIPIGASVRFNPVTGFSPL